jgi:hypothetical protein
MTTPTKRCDLLVKHEPHEWYEGNVFRRQCPGRTAVKLASRSRRAGHPRNAGKQ